MPDERIRDSVGPLFLRTQSDKLIRADEIADKIENFERTPEGTLRSIRGPLPWIPQYETANGITAYPSYGEMHGIYHALLESGQRDVLLIHTGSEIWEFEGFNRSWRELVSSTGLLNRTLKDDERPQFPCQFESTPKGIVIAPQGGCEPLMYDGHVLLPLGYNRAPGAPSAHGPSQGSDLYVNANNTGYSKDFEDMNWNGNSSSPAVLHTTTPKPFGDGQLGTVQQTPGMETPSANNKMNAGNLLRGSYRCRVQWVNYFGDLSPLSSHSGPILFSQEPSDIALSDTEPARLDTVLKQVVWTDLSVGPEGTVGRIINRTKDEVNSGTLKTFFLPGDNGLSLTGGYATIPDNVSQRFPDNTSDADLIHESLDVMPVPKFKLCKMALGRLWVANTTHNPGLLVPSIAGRWGTFLNDTQVYPDPSGDEITGLWRYSGGLLVFTAESTYFVEPGYSGDQPFRSSTVHPSVGCVAPSSLGELPTGQLVWLGRDGFYAYDGQTVSKISEEIQRTVTRISPSRARQACSVVEYETTEYMCWVPTDDSTTNNLCLIYDGQGWRQRTGEKLSAVCRTKDHRKYILGAGNITDSEGTPRDGVWLLNHEVKTFVPASRTATIETAWISAARSNVRKTAFTVKLWLRETHTSGTLTVDVYRDWRKGAPTQTITFDLDSPEDAPEAWDSTVLGTSDATWIRPRPYWIRKDISVPSCEVYKLVLSTTSPVEFIGMSIDEGMRAGNIHMPR